MSTELNIRPSNQQNEGLIEVASARAAQEIQAAMVIAKRFPRNEEASIQRIRRSCQRRSLAEVAQYAYPRASTTVTGPSIRLAEVVAQNWQNIDFGVVELEQRNGESTVMAYAWDLETNARSTKIFQVRHERKAANQIKALSDPRDIYELIANQGARRLRSCILSVVPGDVIDIAMEECDKTLKSGQEPLIDRLRKMAAAFFEIGVSVEMLERRLQHKLDATIEPELVALRKIYTSIKDGAATRDEFFEVAPAPHIQEQPTQQPPAQEQAVATPPQAPKRQQGRPRKTEAAVAAEPPHEPPAPTPAPAPAPPPTPTAPAPAQSELPGVSERAALNRLLAESKIPVDQFLAWGKETGGIAESLTDVEQANIGFIRSCVRSWAGVMPQIKAYGPPSK